MSTDDDSNPLGPAVRLVRAAVELGGRATDAGDAAGAYDLFACAARLVRRVRGLSEVADFRLERALDEAEADSDPDVIREAFESLLPDDDEPPAVPDDPLAAVQRFIQMAISIGAPAYNLDDRQGCYDVYSCTARMILATLTGADAARTRLREALDVCDTLDDSDKQAWAMRHGFDAVLEMGGPTGPALAPSEVRQLLAAAISIGAPAFNLGDSRGCYEVYGCTARLLVNSVSVPDEIKARLRKALEEAAVLPEVARQAWVMRHAFDAVLGGSTSEPEE
ncbi:hypothetical protein [Limnoglobus roseus]|uniref:Uncharacterized protein n=1 Tax=Limnoglobus roseus TaxID=2598579 RepID=A0A5C1A8T5_9BACT|nr:hypothetical protein [Limnoglobus roseus]QEL14925.1 hypothetical protein PX52LOC_01826 [Limnoglobus roseus]